MNINSTNIISYTLLTVHDSAVRRPIFHRFLELWLQLLSWEYRYNEEYWLPYAIVDNYNIYKFKYTSTWIYNICKYMWVFDLFMYLIPVIMFSLKQSTSIGEVGY